MKSVYERANLIISEFDTDGMIATDALAESGSTPETPAEDPLNSEKENRYLSFGSFNKAPGDWF